MSGQILLWLAILVPDNYCNLALIELFLVNHWLFINRKSLHLVQRLAIRVLVIQRHRLNLWCSLRRAKCWVPGHGGPGAQGGWVPASSILTSRAFLLPAKLTPEPVPESRQDWSPKWKVLTCHLWTLICRHWGAYRLVVWKYFREDKICRHVWTCRHVCPQNQGSTRVRQAGIMGTELRETLSVRVLQVLILHSGGPDNGACILGACCHLLAFPTVARCYPTAYISDLGSAAGKVRFALGR